MTAASPPPGITPASLPDAALLHGWAHRRDEASFRALADRYGALVLAAARRCAGHADLAEEAAQMVFTILARKAGALGQVPLAAWLHRTTVLECRSLLRKESRHRRRTRALAEETAAPVTAESGGNSWHEVLDEAIDRLAEEDRRILLQRFFENLSFREIAARAGRSEAAVQRQGHRAMQRLGCMLRRRGVVLSGTALAGVLATTSSNGSAAGFIGGILSGTGPQPGAAALFFNTLYTMTRTKLALTTAAAVTLLAAVPTGLQWREINRLSRDLERAQSQAVKLEQRLAAVESRRLSAVAGTTAGVPRPAAVSPSADSGGAPQPAAAGDAPDVLMGAGEKEVATRITARVAQLRERLQIRADQEPALQQAAASRSAAVLAAFGRIRQNKATPPDMGILAEWAMGAMPIEVAPVLDAGQAAAFREFEAAERTSRVESMTNMELLEMQSQGALHLTAEQKDSAFRALSAIIAGEDTAGPAYYADDGRFTERVQSSIQRRREAMLAVLDAGQQVEYSRMLEEDFAQVMSLFPPAR